MYISDLGEANAIKRLRATIKERGVQGVDTLGYELLLGIGDDAAAWRPGHQITELSTTDTVVEEVHFTRATTPWYDLGWKVMASNVSDIVAMGGIPVYALITLGLPPNLEVKALDLLYDGMLDIAKEYGFSIVGGDIVRSPVMFVSVALTGATQDPPILRSGAIPGHQVAVAGYLGSSAGGLKLLLQGEQSNQSTLRNLTEAHRKPRPRVTHGRTLAAEGVQAAIDVSDGLVGDLSKLCQESHVAAQINAHQIPVDPLLKQAFPDDYLSLALGGGEDYALLFTAPPETMKRVLPHLLPPVAVVGDITEGASGQVTVVDVSGRDVTPSYSGWDHYN